MNALRRCFKDGCTNPPAFEILLILVDARRSYQAESIAACCCTEHRGEVEAALFTAEAFKANAAALAPLPPPVRRNSTLTVRPLADLN